MVIDKAPSPSLDLGHGEILRLIFGVVNYWYQHQGHQTQGCSQMLKCYVDALMLNTVNPAHVQ
jgi:hypothetical protein